MSNETDLRNALARVLQHILEDVPAERMSKHLISEIEDAQTLLTDDRIRSFDPDPYAGSEGAGGVQG